MTTTYGTDRSHWQGIVDDPTVKAAGYEYVIIKATNGANGIDPNYMGNRQRAKAAGLAVGFYHFAEPGDPVEQAQFFADTIRTVGDMPPWLDLETNVGADQAWAETFMAETDRLLHVTTGYYGSPGFYGGYTGDAITKRPLWAARYGPPPDAHPWAGVTIWQYSQTGRVPGVEGNCDLNVSSFTVAQLAALVVPPDPAYPVFPGQMSPAQGDKPSWDQLTILLTELGFPNPVGSYPSYPSNAVRALKEAHDVIMFLAGHTNLAEYWGKYVNGVGVYSDVVGPQTWAFMAWLHTVETQKG